MSPSSKKNIDNNRNNSLFLKITTTAVVAAVLLIVLGRVAVSMERSTNIISEPVVIKPTTQPVTNTPAITNTVKPTVTPPVITLTPVLPTPATLPLSSLSKGSATAPVTLVMYTDFQCAHCQQFAATVEKELETTYVKTGKVLMEYKFIAGFGEESRLANLAAAAAAEQGQFWLYYDILMQLRASPKVEGDLSIELLTSIAQQMGFDMEKFNNSLLTEKYAALVDKDDSEGRAMGIDSTPMFYINGIQKAGARSLADLQSIIDPLLEKASE